MRREPVLVGFKAAIGVVSVVDQSRHPRGRLTRLIATARQGGE